MELGLHRARGEWGCLDGMHSTQDLLRVHIGLMVKDRDVACWKSTHLTIMKPWFNSQLCTNQLWWLMSVILAPTRLSQEDQQFKVLPQLHDYFESEASLG